jgi:hypothetical protein
MKDQRHEFPTDDKDALCVHCGCKPSDAKHFCKTREIPRAIPTSIFAGDIAGIGEEMRAIATREGRPYQERKPE